MSGRLGKLGFSTAPCNVCGAEANSHFVTQVLRAHQACFHLCGGCGLLFTPTPHWLAEAYESPIALADTGILARNIRLARIASAVSICMGASYRPALDVSGGYGVLVRLMRDIGIDCYWSDPYCQNLFAKGFEATADMRFDSVTAFEVLEHLTDPVGFIGDVFAKADIRYLLFSTELFVEPVPAPRDWWYYAFSEGQHVSFYQVKTLRYIAARLGLFLSSHGSVHMLSRRPISKLLFRISLNRYANCFLFLWAKLRLKSRTMADHELMTNR